MDIHQSYEIFFQEKLLDPFINLEIIWILLGGMSREERLFQIIRDNGSYIAINIKRKQGVQGSSSFYRSRFPRFKEAPLAVEARLGFRARCKQLNMRMRKHPGK